MTGKKRKKNDTHVSVNNDKRSEGIVVLHKKQKHELNHNPSFIQPPFPKVIQPRTEDTCVQLAFTSVLKYLSTLHVTKETKDMWDASCEECTANFHDVVVNVCHDGKYKPKLGYSHKCVEKMVSHLTNSFFRSRGFYLKCASARRFTHRTFFNMSSGQRKKRCFLILGYYPSTDKYKILLNKINIARSSTRTMQSIYDPQPDSYWLPKSSFSKHAIALYYDEHGNGIIDDPGHQKYHPLTIEHFFRSCACIGSVFEFSIQPFDASKGKKHKKKKGVDLVPNDVANNV